MVKRHLPIILLTVLCILCIAGCGEKSTDLHASAALWNLGDWALYDIHRIGTDGSEINGTLKISSVGQEMIEGHPYHWLEIREDSDQGVTITKFLAREKDSYNPEDGFTFWDDIKRLIIQQDANQPEEVPEQHIRRYAPHFIESGSAKRYGNVENVNPPQKEILPETEFTVNNGPVTAQGKRNVQHFTSSVNLGFLNLQDTTESSTEYYRNPDLPFGGIVKATLSSTTTSVNKLKPEAAPKPPQVYEIEMKLKAFGNGAESQIIGTPVEMEVMPFPFLEAARKGATGA
ncbi:MAG TPA: hypothetical protein PLV45_03235 [bacterium]|nr:hypothetical protein [bacterium]